MIGYVIVFAVGAIVGFIGGALVYRNNKKKFDSVIDAVDKE